MRNSGDALRAFLEADGRFEIVATARNGQEGVALATSVSPDVVLMDLDMPLMDGVEATRLIHAQHPALPILILSGSPYAEKTAHAVALGAAAHTEKRHLTTDLIEAMLALAR